MKGSFITAFPMINRMCVTLYMFLEGSESLTSFLWPECEYFCEMQSYVSYDQQDVNDAAYFCERQSNTIFSMTNRVWVTFALLWQVISWHLFLWPIVCKHHCTFLWKVVSQPTASEWYWTLLWRGVSWYFLLWITESKWDYIFVKGSIMIYFPTPTVGEFYCTFL